MNDTKVYRINSPQVISENIDGEVVIANLQTGIYYSIERVGADVWPWFENGISEEDLVKTAVAHYSGDRSDIEAGMNAFVQKLLTERLITEATPSVQSHGPEAVFSANGNGKRPFEKPVLESYSDMQDLLLLDPIHDVDEAGWPTKPKQ